MGNIETKIGQNAFQAPTVFNFYHADFSPHGAISSAGLVAPEAELATAPNVINMLNGLSGLIDHGLTQSKQSYSARTFSEDSAISEGVLKYRPKEDADPAAIINELALLLTAGRLSAHTRQVLVKGLREAIAHGFGEVVHVARGDGMKQIIKRTLQKALKVTIGNSFCSGEHNSTTHKKDGPDLADGTPYGWTGGTVEDCMVRCDTDPLCTGFERRGWDKYPSDGACFWVSYSVRVVHVHTSPPTKRRPEVCGPKAAFNLKQACLICSTRIYLHPTRNVVGSLRHTKI